MTNQIIIILRKQQQFNKIVIINPLLLTIFLVYIVWISSPSLTMHLLYSWKIYFNKANFFVLILYESFLHQAVWKLTLMGLLGDILVLLLVEVFFVGVWENLLELSLHLLKFSLLWLLSFMGLYMLWRKLKRWSLLMSGWNVILLWFVLRLLLGPMFLGCFIIDAMKYLF